MIKPLKLCNIPSLKYQADFNQLIPDCHQIPSVTVAFVQLTLHNTIYSEMYTFTAVVDNTKLPTPTHHYIKVNSTEFAVQVDVQLYRLFDA